MERLGIFGGTFDPVHVGHIAVAAEVRHALALDRLLLVPAGDPWQKEGMVVASAADRLAMVQVAAAEAEGLGVDPIEVERGGPTYTVDTLEALQRDDRALFLVMGADVARRLHTWHRPERVRELATIVVFARDGEEPVPDAGDGTCTVVVPRLDVSSTDVRDRLRTGRPVDGLVPASVVRLIRERRLYTRS